MSALLLRAERRSCYVGCYRQRSVREDVRHDASAGLLEGVHSCSLLAQSLNEMGKHAQGHLAPVAVLRGSRLQAYGQFLKINPVPGQRENLAADTPPEGVGHVEHDLDIWTRVQLRPHHLILVTLEEPLARVIFSEQGDRGDSRELPATSRQLQHSL